MHPIQYDSTHGQQIRNVVASMTEAPTWRKANGSQLASYQAVKNVQAKHRKKKLVITVNASLKINFVFFVQTNSVNTAGSLF